MPKPEATKPAAEATPDASKPNPATALVEAIMSMDGPAKAEILEKMQALLNPAPMPGPDGERPLRTVPPLPTFKLYFTGGDAPLIPLMEVMDDETATPVPTNVYHVTGRTHPPTPFKTARDDERPHAFVTRALGEELRKLDRAPKQVGSGDQMRYIPGPCRYEWSPEALKAFAELDAVKAQAIA